MERITGKIQDRRPKTVATTKDPVIRINRGPWIPGQNNRCRTRVPGEVKNILGKTLHMSDVLNKCRV